MTTGEAAAAAGVLEPYIQQLIRWKKIKPPPKVGGKRVWSLVDVERLREVIQRNR